MAEYIKVDDVIDLARRGYLVGNRNFKSAEAFILGIPTADVIERKTGKWEERTVDDPDDKYGLFRRRFYCSSCGDWQTYGKPRFCPNCGAKMEVTDG